MAWKESELRGNVEATPPMLLLLSSLSLDALNS
jgi:hypothetical protein